MRRSWPGLNIKKYPWFLKIGLKVILRTKLLTKYPKYLNLIYDSTNPTKTYISDFQLIYPEIKIIKSTKSTKSTKTTKTTESTKPTKTTKITKTTKLTEPTIFDTKLKTKLSFIVNSDSD